MRHIIAAALLSLSLTATSFAQQSEIKASQDAEYHDAKVILVHTPGNELQTAMLHPRAALFDRYFSIPKARAEHDNYRAALKERGAEVYTLKELMLSGCVDSNGNNIEGEELDALRRLAIESLHYDTSELSDSEATQQIEYQNEVIRKIAAEQLFDIIINQPTLRLSKTKHNTGIAAEYIYSPLYNLFYTRDQMITTPSGVVIGKLNSAQRRNESKVMEFAIEKLGITPIHTISSQGAFLEGGDYVSMDNIAFIGCGMRTTQEAIDELLEHDAFGADSVVVVHDKRFYQPQMHLDTYFNVIDRDLVTLAKERMTLNPNDDTYLTYSLYTKNSAGRYTLVEDGEPFIKLLTDQLGIDIITIKQSDQDHFANNFLTIGKREIIAVANQSEEFQRALKEHNVDVTWVDMENLILGYGAAHCMTQVLLRD